MNLLSELEIMIIYDMEDNGFDPDIASDVEAYWKERLPECT